MYKHIQYTAQSAATRLFGHDTYMMYVYVYMTVQSAQHSPHSGPLAYCSLRCLCLCVSCVVLSLYRYTATFYLLSMRVCMSVCTSWLRAVRTCGCCPLCCAVIGRWRVAVGVIQGDSSSSPACQRARPTQRRAGPRAASREADAAEPEPVAGSSGSNIVVM
jgi:hypothetical protein